MKRRTLVIAGILLAAGTAAAISAPHFRGGHHMRHGMFDGLGEGFGPMLGPMHAALGDRLKEIDADQDGGVTLEEFLAPRAPALARFDRNGDGEIDAAEFAAAAKDSSDYWIKRFIKRFDANRDGRVDKEEFNQFRRQRFAARDLDGDGVIGPEDLPPGMRERVRRWFGRDGSGPEGAAPKDGSGFSLKRLLGFGERRFGRLDKNADGFIDAADLGVLAAERIGVASQRFFRRFDANADGAVTRDEFNRFSRERFARLDLDDDGRITESDLPPVLRGRGILK
jgi:Ca2+-binding EF-hand superfamily protein